jgi:hypothetical protein
VPQVVHVLDPAHPAYNAEAARAMTPEHAGIECYTCHAGWNVNFLGFHFDRNASLSQLDLLSGARTPGRVTTQETPVPLCSGENLYTLRGFRPYLEAGAMDVASIDVIWNGFAQSLKIAALAETHEVACAPHNYYSHLATFIAAQWCAAIPNVRLLEIDVDDVPWREELTTAVPEIRDGQLVVPAGPGWGCDVQEDVLAAHPVS